MPVTDVLIWSRFNSDGHSMYVVIFSHDICHIVIRVGSYDVSGECG